MALLATKFEKRSFGLTSILMVGLVFLMVVLGLQYMDPPDENGILISFGTTTSGAATTSTNAVQEPSIPEPTPVAPEEVPESTPVVEQQSKEEVEELLTEETSEVVIPKEELKVKEAPEPKEVLQEAQPTPKEPTPKEETQPEAVKEAPVPAPPKPDQKTTDALANILGAQEATPSQGDGLSNAQQGDPKGDPYAASFYGTTDANGTEGYGLSGRSLSGFQIYKQECDQEGTVVVRILVDQNGRVIEADPGIKGTTNNASCLLEPAKRTAMSYRWDADEHAPDRQIGFVVIHFKLGQ